MCNEPREQNLMHGRFARCRKWRACDVGNAKEGLENELRRRWSNGRFGEWAPLFPSLHLRHRSFSNPSVALPTSQLISNLSFALTSSQALLILQFFRHFTDVTAHSPTLPSLYLHHSSFPNPSVASPTSQLILQPFIRSDFVTGSAHSPISP